MSEATEWDAEGPPPDLARTPPQDIAAERSVLGSVMLSRDALEDVTEIICGADFYRPQHEAIWSAITDLHEAANPVDAVTVAAELMRRRELDKVGGTAYLHALVSAVPTAVNAPYYARLMLEKSRIRRHIAGGTRTVQAGWDPGITADELDAIADREVQAATAQTTVRDRPVSQMLDDVFEGITAAAQHDGTLIGIPSGFADLDALTGGFRPGEFIIIAARPAIGKSTFGLDIVRAAAIHHKIPTGIKSLEMGATEIMARMLSAEARVLLSGIRKGDLKDVDLERLVAARPRIEQATLLVDDTPDATLASVRAMARKLRRQAGDGPAILVVDYLQLMMSGRKVENRQQEVSEFSRGLKLIAKAFNIVVVALSQLNRGPEQRTDKKPFMSDMRESGSLEQDADMVILLHREDAYDKESPRAGEADFIVAKHRNGPTDVITVAFQGHYSRFVDMAGPSQTEPREWTPTSAVSN